MRKGQMTPAEQKRAYNRAYYLKKKAEIIAQHREYRATPAGKAMRRREKKTRRLKHPEKIRAEERRYYRSDHQQQYRLATRDRQLANRKAYYRNHREHLLAKGDEWYAQHRDETLEKRRARGELNTAENREWRRRNPELAKLNHNRKWHHRRAVKKQAVEGTDRKATAARVTEIRSADVLPCHWCGKPTTKGDRHVDHIIPLNKRGKHSAENLCCACPRCNCSKGDKYPHEFKPRPLTG